MTTDEANKKTKPDWAARVLGVLGLLLSVASILWQVHVYRESHAENVIARVTIHHMYRPHEDVANITREGAVSVEVVNIGQQVLYLRKVSIEACYPTVGSQAGVFYESGSIRVADVPRLEPSASRMFWIKKWEFDAVPLEPQDDDSPDSSKNYCVIVQSTKGEILRSPVGLPSVEVTWTPKRK